MALTNNQLSLIKLYLAAFNRAPEKNGLDYWATQMSKGSSMASVVSTVFSLPVVKAIYPDVLPDDAFLTQIYINVFNRLPDEEGLKYWMGKLELGAQRSALVMDMINAGLSVPDGTPGKAFIVNRYTASQYAVNVQLENNASYNVNMLKEAMAGVNADPTSLQTANKTIDAINTGGLDGPPSAMTVTGAANGYITAAAKAAGLSVQVGLTGTNAVAGNTVLLLVNDALFPTSITQILTATDVKAGKVTVKLPSTVDWGSDGTKVLSVKIANVPAGHISPAGGHVTLIMDTTAPGAPATPITPSIASMATTGISAAQKSAGVSVVVSLAGTNAAEGDTVSLLLNGSPFTTPVTRVLTAAEIAAVSVSMTIGSAAGWGTDGTKNLSARITDAAGNVGTAGGALSLAMDTAPPTLSSSSPSDNATAVSMAASIVLTFTENIAAGTGNIVVSNGSTDTRTIAVTDATQVTISGKTLTINLTLPLQGSTAYNVQLASGVITDVAGNAYAGIANATTLNFTTSALPTYTVAQATSALAANPAALYLLSDTAANLAADAATNAGAGTCVTGRNVVFTTSATIAQVSAVDAATTGTLTYSLSDLAANLFTNTGGHVKAGINVTVTDAGTIAQLAAIDSANTTGLLTYTSITDAAATLATNTGGYVKTGINVVVNNSPSIAQLAAIDTANTTGTLTYASAVTDTGANLRADALLNSGAGRYVTGHNVIFTGAATIAQLTAVDNATTGTLTYASGVADTAAALQADAATNSGAGTYVTGHDVTFIDAPGIAQLAAVKAATTGTLTYTSMSDSAGNLTTNTGGFLKPAIDVTVTGTATIAQMTTIDAANGSGTLNYALADNAATLLLNAGDYVKAGIAVTVNNSAAIANLAAIDSANGSAALTYTEISDTAANLAANTGSYVKPDINVTITTSPSIAELTAIDNANGTGTLTYTAVTDTSANLRNDALLNSGAGRYVSGHDVIFLGTATIAQLAAVDSATSGTLTYANGVSDTAANLHADAISNSGDGRYVDGHAVTFTDAASIVELAAVALASGQTMNYTAVRDTAAALVTNTDGYVKAGINVTVTNAASMAQLTTINAANGNGTLSYASGGITDTVANLLANVGGYVTDGINVATMDAGTIAQLLAIDAANGTGTVTYTAGIADGFAGYIASAPAIALINGAAAGTVTFTNAGAETTLNVSGITQGVAIVGNGIDETLTGGGGADTISGGGGADTVSGGAGIDVLAGGTGADTFRFGTGHSGSTTGTADRITDLAVGDRIDLSALTNVIDGVFSNAAKGSALNGDAATVGLAGLDDGKYDAWVATSDGNDYLVIETAANGSATEIIQIGTTAPGTLATWTFASGIITVV